MRRRKLLRQQIALPSIAPAQLVHCVLRQVVVQVYRGFEHQRALQAPVERDLQGARIGITNVGLGSNRAIAAPLISPHLA